MLSKFTVALLSDHLLKIRSEISKIFECSVIKQRFKCFIEHDNDIAFFSLSQIISQTNQFCESIDFFKCKQQQKRRIKQFLIEKRKKNKFNRRVLLVIANQSNSNY